MIKAIDTVYKGCRFRSRLEARWAVALDSLGIAYRYELEGFDLDGTYYLPDFFLPFPSGTVWEQGTPKVAGYWLEIKPFAPDESELAKLSKLAQLTKHHAYLFYGDLKPNDFGIVLAAIQGGVEKPREGQERQEFARDEFVLSGLFFHFGIDFDRLGEKIAAALDRGSQARFEHGEKP